LPRTTEKHYARLSILFIDSLAAPDRHNGVGKFVQVCRHSERNMGPNRCKSIVAPTRRNIARGLRKNALRGTALAVLVATCASDLARADEGGVSFWVPGIMGSLSAAPPQPGFAFANIYYHAVPNGGADIAFARQVTRGNIAVNFTGNLNLSLRAIADMYAAAPSYTLEPPVLGGRATVSMLVPYMRAKGSVDATLTGLPGGFSLSGSASDTVTALGDVAPQFAIAWNAGVHNYMTYVTGNLTTGSYDPSRLANTSLGHNAIDAGGAYTYLNPQTGYEFSAALGFTYNFENTHTQYKNGIDMHLDWGASKFLSKQLFIGPVGYFYNQLTCDSGSGNRVGCFESRVAGIGPQIGYIFPLSERYSGYINVKGYKEFGDEHRAAGWNAWLTFAISPSVPSETAPTRTPLLRK
jgi:hypothetical protein